MPKEIINTGVKIESYTPPRYKVVGKWVDSLLALSKKIPDDDKLKKDLDKLIEKFRKEADISFKRGDT